MTQRTMKFLLNVPPGRLPKGSSYGPLVFVWILQLCNKRTSANGCHTHSLRVEKRVSKTGSHFVSSRAWNHEPQRKFNLAFQKCVWWCKMHMLRAQMHRCRRLTQGAGGGRSPGVLNFYQKPQVIFNTIREFKKHWYSPTILSFFFFLDIIS